MKELQNDTLLRALLKQPIDRTPVWIMRQAGRYLPEYREIRAQAGSFMNLCTNPELACEVTMQPLRRFKLDAAILFSDILTIPDAMGLGLYFEEGEGPKFKSPLRDANSIKALGVPDPEENLAYVTDAVRKIRQELNGKVPLIGFSGSPWTLATYMVEGGSSKDFKTIKGMAFENPSILHHLLDINARAVIDYLNAQIKAGAQAAMIFDTWGGVLSTEMYQAFSLQYMQQIVDGLIREHEGRQVPVILFTKNGGQWLDKIAATGCDAAGCDWTITLSEARAKVDDKIALQGNVDPCLLYANAERIEEEVQKTLASFGKAQSGHVFNLGHGIHPAVNPENLGVLIDAVHKFSPAYHS